MGAMTAATLTADRTIELHSRPVPALQEGELLVQVLATGVCGSDLAAWRGTHPYKRAPAVLGHELCGRVVEVAEPQEDFRPGDLVCSAAYAPCGACTPCGREQMHLCRSRSNLSHGGWDGSFAEYVVTRAVSTFRLPPDLDPRAGALVEPLSIAAHAVRLPQRLGPATAVIGCGPIGLSCLIAMREHGVDAVAGIDLGPQKGARFAALGGTSYADAAAGDAAAVLRGSVPDGFDTVFVATGYPQVMHDALTLLRPGGDLVVVSYFDQAQSLDLNAFVSSEARLHFSALSTRHDFEEVIGWFGREGFDPTPMISHEFALQHAADALQVLDGQQATGKVLLRTDFTETP